MCGRYTLRRPAEAVAAALQGMLPDGLADLPPRYNAAPTQPLPVVVAAGGHKRRCTMMRWGLVPQWMKPRPHADPARQVPGGFFNARSETAASKPAFRGAFRHRRCLVPADGFYEWANENGRKTPFLFSRHDETPFAFAGLHETWCPPDGSELGTFTVLTCRPNALLAAVHDRMPVTIDEEDHDRWLHGDRRSVADLLAPSPSERWTCRAVDPRVGNVRLDGPSLVEPPGPEQPPRSKDRPVTGQHELF